MLKVLGAGLSRTGTFSLKRALERIGFGPCYHMDEVFRRPDHVAMWGDASLREPDWRVLLDGCVSAADAPVCHFWRQIRDAYPDAKVVLTVRDSESWYESFHATVFQTMMHPTLVPAPARAPLEMARRLVLDGIFSGRFEDKAHAIAVYEAHNRAVTDSIDPRDLLVHDIADGWAPLCSFLGVRVPTDAFPVTNARAQFRDRVGLE